MITRQIIAPLSDWFKLETKVHRDGWEMCLKWTGPFVQYILYPKKVWPSWNYNFARILYVWLSKYVLESIPGAFVHLLRTFSASWIYTYCLGPLTPLIEEVIDFNNLSQMCESWTALPPALFSVGFNAHVLLLLDCVVVVVVFAGVVVIVSVQKL